MRGLREIFKQGIRKKPATEPPASDTQSIAWSESGILRSLSGTKWDPDTLKTRKGGNRIYDTMMLDEQVKAVMRFKRDAITSRDYTFEFGPHLTMEKNEKERRRAVFEAITHETRGSFLDQINKIMLAMRYGYSISEKILGPIQFDGRTYTGLKALMKKPVESIGFDVDDFGNLKQAVQELDGKQQTLDLSKFVYYVQNPEEDEHYGQSELRSAYRSWWHKDTIIKLWSIFLERNAGFFWAEPEEGSQLRAGTAEYKSLQAALEHIQTLTAMIMPRKVKLQHMKPENTDQYQRALEYHDLSIAKSLLVPNLLGLSHTGQTGAFAQSQTQFKAFYWTVQADSLRLEDAVDEQIFRELGDLNFGDTKYPRFKFKPLLVDQVMDMLARWKDLVQVDAVEPSETDEAMIRELLELPEKGAPIKRREPVTPPGADGQAGPPDLPGPGARSPSGSAGANGQAGSPQFTSPVSFARASKRVAFAVIDRRSTDLIDRHVGRIEDRVATALAPLIESIELGKLGTPAGDANVELRFDSGSRSKIRKGFRLALEDGWALGRRHAEDEVAKARRGTFRVDMERLETVAAAFFDSKSFNLSADVEREVLDVIQNVMSNGIKYSWTTPEVVRKIYTTLASHGVLSQGTVAEALGTTPEAIAEALEGAGTTTARLFTAVRTTVFEALNEARYSFFTDPALDGFVEAFEYSAILDSRTTAICRHLDGRIFSEDSPNWDGYRPPNHFNCRSLLIPVTTEDRWEPSRDPTLDPQDGFGAR